MRIAYTSSDETVASDVTGGAMVGCGPRNKGTCVVRPCCGIDARGGQGRPLLPWSFGVFFQEFF